MIEILIVSALLLLSLGFCIGTFFAYATFTDWLSSHVPTWVSVAFHILCVYLITVLFVAYVVAPAIQI